MSFVGAIDGGTYFHHRTLTEAPFETCFDEIVYIGDVAQTDLSRFDILFLPCRLNSLLIAPLKGQLVAYMQGGGTLIVMGEIFPDRWLDGIEFTPCQTNFWWWITGEKGPAPRIANPSHALMKNMTASAATWHLHGHFAPKPEQEALIEDDIGVLMFEDRQSYAPGRLIATSLDPCYHHGSHFMPAATQFLEALLPQLREL
ncbi:hypothetical protein [Labrenzia sp. 011]|uniref:hypothetical protein n=1 Tax=Labrenzia sp. 011 TaxID=2171494 RepID=UPI000D507E59|nr:hypothetical protein [Labrenzia sp. 011]PVB60175.1 hypothetical protein DCO57_18610 [Labrenzia sp. 011]